MRRVVVAGMIGNGLEWYDFALFGYLVPLFGKLFFPGSDTYAQWLYTYGIFAAGFLTRPLGAVLFGYLGDRYGRKFSLALSMFMMGIPTALMGMLPTYQTIGIMAPVLLTLVRLIQGISLAGQFSGSITFIVEHAPAGKRGLAGSSTIMSLCGGMLAGLLAMTIMSSVLSQEQFESWGWRIPFLMGLVIGLVGYYIRHKTHESPHYMKAKHAGKLSDTPVRHILSEHYKELARGIGMYLSVTVPFYTLTVYLNGFMQGTLGYSSGRTYTVDTISMLLMIVLMPLTAHLTDKVGRKPVLMWTCVGYFFTAFPIVFLLNLGTYASTLIAIVLLTIMVSFYGGAIPALLVELFPTRIRYTGMSIAYNVAAVVGGFTPALETKLVRLLQVDTRVAIHGYFMICAIAAFCVYQMRHEFQFKGRKRFTWFAVVMALIALILNGWFINQGHIDTLLVALYIMLCCVVSFISFFHYHDSYKEELI